MSSDTRPGVRQTWAIQCRDATGAPATLRLWRTADGGVAGTLPQGGFLLSPDALERLLQAISVVQNPDDEPA